MSSRILILPPDELVEYSLSKLDCEINIADSEDKALHLLQGEHFDLLILKEFMPGMSGFDFLAEWRSKCKSSDTLALMIRGRTGYPCIVRLPAYQDQAHAYILYPYSPDELLELVTKLLAGASAQKILGEEGYSRHRSEELAVAFDYPAFWRVGHWRYPEKTGTFVQRSVDVQGPMNCYQTVDSSVGVEMYSPIDPTMHLAIEDVLAYEWRKREVKRVTPERETLVAGLSGKETEYIWSADWDRLGVHLHWPPHWLREGEQGRSIEVVVWKEKNIYVLSLGAADNEFDDFRSVYERLLATFEFLE